ncbi:TPA: hypothetical protein OCX45_004631 [Escherichia coli]|nr:hypothetical protein [Escherichia coli]
MMKKNIYKILLIAQFAYISESSANSWEKYVLAGGALTMTTTEWDGVTTHSVSGVIPQNGQALELNDPFRMQGININMVRLTANASVPIRGDDGGNADVLYALWGNSYPNSPALIRLLSNGSWDFYDATSTSSYIVNNSYLFFDPLETVYMQSNEPQIEVFYNLQYEPIPLETLNKNPARVSVRATVLYRQANDIQFTLDNTNLTIACTIGEPCITRASGVVNNRGAGERKYQIEWPETDGVAYLEKGNWVPHKTMTITGENARFDTEIKLDSKEAVKRTYSINITATII